jgi:nucleoside 2-deoxyribosyltransferase
MTRYGYFIAVPMSSIPASDYQTLKATLHMMCEELREATGKPVFCAPFTGENENFNQSSVAYTMDIGALRQSDHFVMIYPRGVKNSGILFECGYAAALGIPQTIFVEDRETLPYMLREADQQTQDPYQFVTYHSMDEILPFLLATHKQAVAAE